MFQAQKTLATAKRLCDGVGQAGDGVQVQPAAVIREVGSDAAGKADETVEHQVAAVLRKTGCPDSRELFDTPEVELICVLCQAESLFAGEIRESAEGKFAGVSAQRLGRRHRKGAQVVER